MRGALRWAAVAVWTAAMIAIGVWLARAGIFRWHRETLAELRATTVLPPEVRARLRPRMLRHAQAMNALTDAVVMLDHEGVRRATTAILDDPQLARPLTSESAALAAELPPQFHELERSLQAHARALQAAAQSGDDEALVAADADLAWTCAGCHAAFHGP